MSRWLRSHTKAVNNWALEQFSLRPGDRLLEIGFGSGDLLYKALDRNDRLQAAGLDPSEEMVRLAHKRLQPFLRQQRVEIKQGGVEAIPFEASRFSRLISVNTLYFWSSPASALAECRRVLEDQGEFTLCFDAKENLERWRGHHFGFRLYEPPEVEGLLSGTGFDVVDVRSCTFPGYGKAYCVIAKAR